jgi:hypothetical protein
MNYATYAPKEVKKSKVLNNIAPAQPPTPTSEFPAPGTPTSEFPAPGTPTEPINP